MNLKEAFNTLLKGSKMDIGAISTRSNGKQYQKQSNGKWNEYKSGGKDKKSKSLDLKGNPKKLHGYAVGDITRFAPVKGATAVDTEWGQVNVKESMPGKFSVTDRKYGVVISVANSANAAVERAKTNIKNAVDSTSPVALDEHILKITRQIAKDHITSAHQRDIYTDEVKAGIVSKEDAIKIVESAGLDASALKSL